MQQQPQQSPQVELPAPVDEGIETSTEKSSKEWAVYEEENGFFSIQYPPDWSIEISNDPTTQASSHNWQFRGEQISPQSIEGVTLGRYSIPTISDDISLESWAELVTTVVVVADNEIEFERLRMESTEIDGRDAYVIHDRFSPPERDLYITYMRCQNRVWFLHILDIDLESTVLEEIYKTMLDHLSLSCSE